MSSELNYQKQVQNPYPTGSQSYTAFEKGFILGWSAKELNNDQNDAVSDTTDDATSTKANNKI